MLYLVVFIFLVFFTLAFILSEVNISIEHVRNGWKDHTVLSVSIFMGIIKYRYEFSLTDIKENGIKFIRVKKKAVKKEKTEDKSKKMLGFDELYKGIVYLKEKYHSYERILKRLKKYLKYKIAFKELDINITLGTGDACFTGILSGAAWALAGIAMSFLSRGVVFKKEHVDIKSDFNEPRLDVKLICIISVKFVHIIVVGFILLSNYLKRRWFGWQNILYKVL